MKLSMMIIAMNTTIKQMTKVESRGVPVMPCAPLIMSFFVSISKTCAAFASVLIETNAPFLSTVRYTLFMTLLMISPNASVTIAR